ncbi:MAG: hypothetical protein NVSMB39_5570 [Candidatus Saccharimonadales bacterium]
MASRGSLYHILGVEPSATAADIKLAYRAAAKRAPPDAGGSAAAMAKVNEAYQILGDSESRRAYDESESSVPSASSATAPPPSAPTPAYDAAAAQAEAEAVERGRRAWARRSAGELFKATAPWAVGAIFVTRLLSAHIADPRAFFALAVIGFLPIYGFILSLIFLNDPPLRLVFADLARRYPTELSEKAAALGIVLAYVPLALLWSLWR